MAKRGQHRAAVLAVAVLLVLAGSCVFARPASAGGSVWYFDRPSYEPGDVVRAGAAVSWAHYDMLGTPDDGPYGAWITPWEQPAPGTVPDSLAAQIERGRYVTDVRIDVGPQEINGIRYGPNVAWVEFLLPRVAPGLYSLLHCNYPCTTTLGDITLGVFWVGPPVPGAPSTSGQSPVPTVTNPPTTAVLPSTTAALPPTTAATKTSLTTDADVSESDGFPVPVVAAGLVAVAAGGVVAVTRGRRRPGRDTS